MAQVTDVSRGSPSAETLRQRIDSERRALDRSLDELGDRVRETMDWRRQAARHRGKLLAAGGGLLLAGAWRWHRRRQPRARVLAAVTRAADAVNRQACQSAEQIRERLAGPPRQGWMRTLIAPLAVAAFRAALAWREREDDEYARGGTARPNVPGRARA